MTSAIQQIHSINIIDIVSKHVQLTQKGARYTARCPFPGHDEKSASFTVTPAKNICWCFGCNRGGDAINFIQILKQYERPVEAIKHICQEHNIPFNDGEFAEKDETAYKHREALRIVLLAAQEFFTQCLNDSKPAMDYALSRMNTDMIERFSVGYAPDSWHALEEYMGKKGYKREIMMEAGLLSESKNRVFDTFRNRIMFPVFDMNGNILGFSARVMDDSKPKYINSSENALYHKKEMLYGIHLAKQAIRTKGGAYLVEGNTDVIHMHRIGVENTVATSGTALTQEQINLLKRLTDSIIIIGDSDLAGTNAMHKSAEMIIQAGMNCNILPLPEETGDDGKPIKHDPASFFTSTELFKQYKQDNLTDYIEHLVTSGIEKVANYPDRKAKLIANACKLISVYPDTRQNLYIETLSKKVKPKKAWVDELKKLKTDTTKPADLVPKDELDTYQEYGFYIQNNSYWFIGKSGAYKGSNFFLKPLFHIESVINAKRLFEIFNENGARRVIELDQKDLVSLSAFKLRVESLGNFIWYGSEIDLNRIKGFLYENTDSCRMITQLGWQPKDNIYAWGNGIFNSEFTRVDDFGIVRYEKHNYYIPAFSKIYQKEEGLFQHERRFIHTNGSMELHEITTQLLDVYGPNVKIALCFYIASLFRDYLFNRFNFFPILNLFGPKGAGKTELAVSLMQFFGHMPKGPNINSTSKPALADHIAGTSNALCHIDEYKNNLEPEKIEFLKGIWDGTGRTRMNMDKDKKKETTPVDIALILTGQEMPTADIALFSRLIFLSFHKVEYDDNDKKKFNQLKENEKKGFTHITHQILALRKEFVKNYETAYLFTQTNLLNKLRDHIIEDRILKNWLVPVAAYAALREFLTLPFTYNDLIDQVASQILVQNVETKKSNEVSTFWNIVEFLNAEGHILDKVDFKIRYTSVFKTDKMEMKGGDSKILLILNHARVLPLYRKHGRMTGENVLPSETMRYYLENDKRYLGKMISVSFRTTIPGTSMIDKDSTHRKVTKGYVFDYEQLKINLDYENEDMELIDDKIGGSINMYEKEPNEAPF